MVNPRDRLTIVDELIADQEKILASLRRWRDRLVKEQEAALAELPEFEMPPPFVPEEKP